MFLIQKRNMNIAYVLLSVCFVSKFCSIELVVLNVSQFKKKKRKKKWSRNECSCKNSESVYACLRLSMWFMSMYFDYIAMIQSRIVLSIYVFCLSWQRREILSKSWWVASSISLFFFFFLHIDNKFKEGRCFNHSSIF